jgi:hypothetical protein
LRPRLQVKEAPSLSDHKKLYNEVFDLLEKYETSYLGTKSFGFSIPALKDAYSLSSLE